MVGSWQTREGRGEDAMKSPLQMLPFFAASLPRVYCACTTFMEMLRRLSHDLRDPTAFSPRSRSDRRTFAFVLNMLKTNAVTRRSLATMATISRSHIEDSSRPNLFPTTQDHHFFKIGCSLVQTCKIYIFYPDQG